MLTNLIIGSGQLGSRHLQGLLKYNKHKQKIYVLDPSEVSLNQSEERAREIYHNHKIIYVTNWNKIPKLLDLVIVATSSNIRFNVVKTLLERFNVKSLVLEKILFQDINSYLKANELITNTKTPTWVNHPRRMFEHYKKLKLEICKVNDKKIFQVYGYNWDLACNSIHFIDLFSFLTNSKVESINFNKIDNQLLKSKRSNYIEFTGKIEGSLEDGSDFNIYSINGEFEDLTFTILTKNKRWVIHEGNSQKIVSFSKDNNFNEEIENIKTEFQSSLTTKIIEDIIENEKCELTPYDEACASHIPFIEGALKKYSQITGINSTNCPIT